MIAACTGERELWGVMSSFQVLFHYGCECFLLFIYYYLFLKHNSWAIILSLFSLSARWSSRWGFWLGEKPGRLVSLSHVKKEAEEKQQTMKSYLHCWGLPKAYLSNKAIHLDRLRHCCLGFTQGPRCFLIVRQTLAANLGCNNCLCSRCGMRLLPNKILSQQTVHFQHYTDH